HRNNFRTKYKGQLLTDYSSQRNDAGSTIVAGMLQVRPKGATKVAPVLLLVICYGRIVFDL
ncbi:hypothetical protein C5F63_06130, partial [Photobacterium damselae subsp. damselae]